MPHLSKYVRYPGPWLHALGTGGFASEHVLQLASVEDSERCGLTVGNRCTGMHVISAIHNVIDCFDLFPLLTFTTPPPPILSPHQPPTFATIFSRVLLYHTLFFPVALSHCLLFLC